MIVLEHPHHLPVEHLAAGFSEVTNSYKFYWFLAILERIRENSTPIVPLNDLLVRMIAAVWYPTNYFRLSFGKQDRLGQIAVQVGMQSDLPMDARKSEVIQGISSCLAENSALSREIKSLGEYVPYRFIRPFFAQQLRGIPDWKVNNTIVELAEQAFDGSENPPLYRFLSVPVAGIEIQPAWFAYLNWHLPTLTGFCLWHLVSYVQKHNPNVPNIPNKLFEPQARDLAQARAFWNVAFEQLGTLRCIYSGRIMHKGAFSLDHFLPWRFVAHDLLWNIVPTPKNVNSAKGDCLPDLNLYLDPFADLQYAAFQAVSHLQRIKLLEDYSLLFKMASINEIQTLSPEAFRTVLHETIAPQFQIAQNMGFSAGWAYMAR